MILPRAFHPAARELAAQLDTENFAARFWAGDGTLFGASADDHAHAAQFLAWRDCAHRTLDQLPELEDLAAQAQADGLTRLLVCGMGGSSLGSLVLQQAFPDAPGLRVEVLDSTVPETVDAALSGDLSQTLVLVASKSGTTVEPLAFEEAAFYRLTQQVGVAAGNHMIAITDPGTPMQERAERRGYRAVILGEPEIGGRFSVLSVFGMTTAALMGADVAEILSGALEFNPSTCSSVRSEECPFFKGLTIAAAARAGHDKLTFVTEPGREAFALWCEQLIAESTGKHGVGVLPLATETEGPEDVYGPDRQFAFVGHDPSAMVTGWIGQGDAPVSLTPIFDAASLGRAFMRWELATAVMGAVLGVNPFDQPNVQLAKDIARGELAKIQLSGRVDLGTPVAEAGDEQILSGAEGEFGEALSAFLNAVAPGDHLGFLAFVPESDEFTVALQTLRLAVRDRLKVATSFGYGPRYLHSTGQYHKGGPAGQKFVLLTSDARLDFEIPGMNITFGQLALAQALGDVGALRGAGRPVLHVHLGASPVAGLQKVALALGVAL